jgi:hypothetical protein
MIHLAHRARLLEVEAYCTEHVQELLKIPTAHETETNEILVLGQTTRSILQESRKSSRVL